MKLNDKGQVTIPAQLRRQFGFSVGDEVEVVADGSTLRIVHSHPAESRGDRLVGRMRGKASTQLSTDDLMELLRGE